MAADRRTRSPTPIPRMTYAEAMDRYGSDKPDLRFGIELAELHRLLRRHPVPGVPGRRTSARSCMPGGASAAAPQLRRLAGVGQAARRPRAWPTSLVGEDGELGGPVAKNLSDAERAGLAAAVGAEPGDCVFFAAGAAEAVAGAARRGPAGDRPALRADRRGRLGVPAGSSTRRCSSRPPTRRDGDVAVGVAAPGPRCTTRSPRPSRSSLDTFDTDPGSALAYAYDIVCNGNEIGGGSIRIHRARHPGAGVRGDGPVRRRRPRRSSASCSTPSRSARRRTAASPSAGTGSSRCSPGADSIREVIAFPKSGGGYDPLTAAPAPITARAAQGGRRRRQAGAGGLEPDDPQA